MDNFYRKPLPKGCVSFGSERGIRAFRESLTKSDFMGIYFPLSEQFRTQDEPAYCGISSLVMVLNALKIDPGRLWKGPWRWYHEDMLSCCKEMELVKREGINLDEFACLALCNACEVSTHRCDGGGGVEEFRHRVKSVCSSASTTSSGSVGNRPKFMVVSYSRKVTTATLLPLLLLLLLHHYCCCHCITPGIGTDGRRSLFTHRGVR